MDMSKLKLEPWKRKGPCEKTH